MRDIERARARSAGATRDRPLLDLSRAWTQAVDERGGPAHDGAVEGDITHKSSKAASRDCVRRASRGAHDYEVDDGVAEERPESDGAHDEGNGDSGVAHNAYLFQQAALGARTIHAGAL